MPTEQGYAQWAPWYDDPGNELIDIEQPIVREILDGLPVGVALDAACGTGRHSAYLASLGHRVIGVDTSPEMLAFAREKLPGVELHEADLHELPVEDNSVDVVVCALALTHVPDLPPVFAEFARVLRPGGHLVTSDSRGLIGDLSPPLVRTLPDGSYGYMETHHRLASGYLDAALPLGLDVRRCVEPTRPTPLMEPDGTYLYDGAKWPAPDPDGPPDIWALHGLCVEATNAAFRESPVAVVWHFQLRDVASV
jgi:SAM-dependent methyltransferase